MEPDAKPTFIERHGLDVLRISVAIVFFWFGFLKFFGATSPAEDIARDTLALITFDQIPPRVSLSLLAVLECSIGIGLLWRKWMRFVVPVLYFQMAGAVLPLFVFPDKCWNDWFVPTLLGQYIIKNIILISAALVLGVESKGGALIADPEVAQKAKRVEEKKTAHENGEA